MPKEAREPLLRESDVWIARFDAARPLAEVLRASLVELHKQRHARLRGMALAPGDLPFPRSNPMSKSRQSHETAKALVSPLFAWTNAVLKGGEMILDSMQAAAKTANTARVAVLPEPDAPKRPARAKAKTRSGRAKAKRPRRRRG